MGPALLAPAGQGTCEFAYPNDDGPKVLAWYAKFGASVYRGKVLQQELRKLH